MTKSQSPTSMTKVRLAIPTPEQAAWQDLEVGMFIHFAPNTWCNREGDDLSVPLDKINPAQLDTDQWVAVAESMGARYIVFVAKHLGGFCWWQTETTEYSVKNTPWRGGKGDVMRDLAESCRRRGMKLGVYLSPADRKHGIGIGGKARTVVEQQAYAELYRQQLTEVLTRYGEIMEVWFDGGLAVDVGDILKKHAPRAMVLGAYPTIRWVGNEDGEASYPAWNAVSTKGESVRLEALTVFDGNQNGDCWLPIETDTVSTVPHAWFWKAFPERRLKTVDELMDAYYYSVGHGTVLLLNQTPDTSGAIPAPDTRRAAEFGSEIHKRFGKSVAERQGTGNLVELDLGMKSLIDHVITMEDISHGERVRQYTIEGEVNGVWTTLCQGTAIGHKKIDFFTPVEIQKLRLRSLLAVGTPMIRKLAAYRTGVTVVQKRDLRKCRYRKIGEWTPQTYEQGTVAMAIDLVPWCDKVTQYEIRIQPQGTPGKDIKVRDVSYRLEGTESRQFVQPTPDDRVYELNLTGLGQQMELDLVLEDTGHTQTAGDILIRQKPLVEGTVRLPQAWQIYSYFERGETPHLEGKLCSIPEYLEVGNRRIKPVGVTAQDGRFDFATIWGKVVVQRVAYIYIPFTVEQDGAQLFGFGADWWFQAWIDGTAFCDTLTLGNGEADISMTDHVATAELKKGEHLLVVRFISGCGSSRIAIGGTQDIRDSRR